MHTLKRDIAEKEQLKARIRDLENENENLKMMRKHEGALVNAANRVGAAERKIDEIKKTRWTAEPHELDL